MRMLTGVRGSSFVAAALFVAMAFTLGGCSSGEKKPAKQQPAEQKGQGQEEALAAAKPAPRPESQPKPKSEYPAKTAKTEKSAPPSLEKDLATDIEEAAEKPRDLGQPLVDDPASLVRLDPKQPIWIDKKNKHVVMLGEVCKAGYPLEFFATYSNRSYEAVMSVNVTPRTIHAGLLAVGAVPGHPARFEPDFAPPAGTEVAIEVRWKDKSGKVQSVPAQKWIRNIKTKKELDSNWVFAGSMSTTDEETGEKHYLADSGDMICVLSLPAALLDLPIHTDRAIESRTFEAFEEHLPPAGTPTTILLKPTLTGKPVPGPTDAHAEEERKAVDAAGPWLALVDAGQYSRSWETAAEWLRSTVQRREFVKAVGNSRKPWGKVVSRQLESKRFGAKAPGTPDGQYVILQYKTVFANHKSATETVTPMLDRDKKWRVSGYEIK
jgi:hypothetical protein